MERMSIRAPDYVLDDRTSEASNRHHVAFFARSRPEPEGAAATAARAYHDAHWDGFLLGVPASSEAVAGLRVPAAGETREQGCAVCLEDFENGDELRTMPCSHSFHQLCVFRWLRVSLLCPYCRFPLPSADEERLPDEQAAVPRPDVEAT